MAKTKKATESFLTEDAKEIYKELLDVSSGGGGGGGGSMSGTFDYEELDNRPMINSVTLSGDKTLAQIGAASANSVSQLNTRIIEAESNINNTNGNVASLGTRMSQAESDIDDIQEQISSGGLGVSSYNDLKNKPKINSVELSGNKTLVQLGIAPSSDVASLGTRMTQAETTINSMGENVTFIDERLIQAETDVDSLQAQIDTAISAVTTDSEVTNIRVGADGTTYETAGEAVRRQVDDLRRDLSYISPTNIGQSVGISRFKESLIDGEVWNTGGTISKPQPNWKRSDLYPVNEGDIITIHKALYTYAIFFDNNKAWVEGFNQPTEQRGTPSTYTLTVPSGVGYFAVNMVKAQESGYKCLVNGVEPDSQYKFEWLKVPIYNIEQANKVSSFKDELIDNEVWNIGGSISTSQSSWKRSKLYPVNEGDVITIHKALYTYAVFFDNNRAWVEGFQQPQSDRGTPTSYTLTVPSGVGYLAFNMVKAQEAEYNCLVNGAEIGTQYRITGLKPPSIWTNKVYISHGDSITALDRDEDYKGYQTVFDENVGLRWRTNPGQGGWPMAIYPGRGGIVQKIKEISDYTPYDLCTVAVGTNDFKLNVSLGTKGQIGDTTFDDSVFYGAYRDGIEHMLKSNPKLRIVLMTPIQRDNSGYDVNYTNSAGCKLIDYVNAIKEIGQMYSLPVCDMYANSGITQLTFSTYLRDGLHPNNEGFLRMGNYLTQFLEGIGN